jgi:methylmalonyl-CoA/ethylmalonyl-CoA epimerase
VAVTGIKHIAFAVADVDAALRQFQEALGVGEGVIVRESSVTNQRSCSFMVGNIQYQLVQSLEPDGRYARWVQGHGESINHICYTVDDLRETVANAVAKGAKLRSQTCRLSDDPDEIARWKATVGPDSVCANCGIRGQYEHPEGWVAFLEESDVPGTNVELMQVYKPEEIPQQYRKGPLDL